MTDESDDGAEGFLRCVGFSSSSKSALESLSSLSSSSCSLSSLLSSS